MEQKRSDADGGRADTTVMNVYWFFSQAPRFNKQVARKSAEPSTAHTPEKKSADSMGWLGSSNTSRGV